MAVFVCVNALVGYHGVLRSPYADDDSELHVPRILQCGHCACQGCYAKMLRPVAADGDYKKLECPECRETTKVLRGKASNLQKNFALLR